MISAGPSVSGKPWPRLIEPVRSASWDISAKIVVPRPCSRVASRSPFTNALQSGRLVITHHGQYEDDLASPFHGCPDQGPSALVEGHDGAAGRSGADPYG